MNPKLMAGIVGFVIIVSILGVVFLILNMRPAEQSAIGESGASERLDFCSTVPECISHLESEGMPAGFLEDNGITIQCGGGACTASR